MKSLIAIFILAMIIVGSGVFFVLRIADLSDQVRGLQVNYSALQLSHTELQSSHTDLQANYNSLEDNYRTTLNNYNLLDTNYNVLQSNFNSLQTDLQSLRDDYSSLESDYKSLESAHNELNSEVSALRFENTQLDREKRDLQRLLDEYESVPNSYYSTNVFKQYSNTWNDLSRFLTSEFKLPRDYELNVFDCSESSAYLEWALENAGFNSEIVVGPDPSGETANYHAWVIAYPTDYTVAIEPQALTTKDRSAWLSQGRVPGVIYGEDKLIKQWEYYYEGYDYKFQNIYWAIRHYGMNQQWNWWEGFFGFN